MRAFAGIAVLFIAVMGVVSGACGVKGPPRPRRPPPSPAETPAPAPAPDAGQSPDAGA